MLKWKCIESVVISETSTVNLHSVSHSITADQKNVLNAMWDN